MLKRKKAYDELESDLRSIEFQELFEQKTDAPVILNYIEKYGHLLESDPKYNVDINNVFQLCTQSSLKDADSFLKIFRFLIVKEYLDESDAVFELIKFAMTRIDMDGNNLFVKSLATFDKNIDFTKFTSETMYKLWQNLTCKQRTLIDLSQIYFALLTGFVHTTQTTDSSLAWIESMGEYFDPDYFDVYQGHKNCENKEQGWFSIDDWCWKDKVQNTHVSAIRRNFEKYRKKKAKLVQQSFLTFPLTIISLIIEYGKRPTIIHICLNNY